MPKIFITKLSVECKNGEQEKEEEEAKAKAEGKKRKQTQMSEEIRQIVQHANISARLYSNWLCRLQSAQHEQNKIISKHICSPKNMRVHRVSFGL